MAEGEGQGDVGRRGRSWPLANSCSGRAPPRALLPSSHLAPLFLPPTVLTTWSAQGCVPLQGRGRRPLPSRALWGCAAPLACSSISAPHSPAGSCRRGRGAGHPPLTSPLKMRVRSADKRGPAPAPSEDVDDEVRARGKAGERRQGGSPDHHRSGAKAPSGPPCPLGMPAWGTTDFCTAGVFAPRARGEGRGRRGGGARRVRRRTVAPARTHAASLCSC